jgi:hypothetical protein
MQQWIDKMVERFCDRIVGTHDRGFTKRDGRENVVDGLFAIAASLNKVADELHMMRNNK